VAGAAAAAGVLALGASASPGAAQSPLPEPPHGQLLQAPDGTLYLLVAGRAHPITPAPLTAEALAAAPTGEALPDGAFWLVPAAAPYPLAPAAPPTPAATLAPFFATQTRVPGVSAFFASQTAPAPPRSGSSQRMAATATASAGRPRPTATPAPRAMPAPGGRPFGQS
jgi:hypothetical protein